MSNPIPTIRQIQSALYRIRSNGIVLHDRVRGDISKQVASNIVSDAEAGLASLHALTASMASASPLTEGPDEAPAGGIEILPAQNDAAELIRALIDALLALSEQIDPQHMPAARIAYDAAMNLASSLGIEGRPPMEITTSGATPGAQGPTESADTRDEVEGVDLSAAAAPLDDPNRPQCQLADEELLAAAQAALAVVEIRETVVIGLQDVHRRIGHCRLLFDQIHEGAQRSSSPPGLGQFADIGRDIATKVQDECIALLQLLENAGKEGSHG